MAEILSKIPDKDRWAISVKLHVGAHIGAAPAFGAVIGKEKLDELYSMVWGGGGKQLKLWLKETFNMPVENAVDAINLHHLASTFVMGPEWEIEIIEEAKEKSVMRITKCAAWERAKEQGTKPDFRVCVPAHQAFGKEGFGAINPKLTFELTKAMPKGDPYCEVIIDFKD